MKKADMTGDNQNDKTKPVPTQNPPSKKSRRGFASMDRERQREIARRGGRAAHEKGTAHEFTSAEAREAGRKGGEAVSKDREHMAAIGREGGQARGALLNRKKQEANAGAPSGKGEKPSE